MMDRRERYRRVNRDRQRFDASEWANFFEGEASDELM
jgi:hypothetical protein